MCTISKSFIGDPLFGPKLITGQQRVLVGWNHFNDTPDALLEGQIWGWVSQNRQPKFQVYDTSGNRSPNAGEVVDCGPANFTMIRMFHPYWCPGGHIPKDKDIPDKKRCRELYHQLVVRRRNQLREASVSTEASTSDKAIANSSDSLAEVENVDTGPQSENDNVGDRSTPSEDSNAMFFSDRTVREESASNLGQPEPDDMPLD